MGLDSVELVMRFEDYFGIQIADKEAENIFTLQHMVDCICSHRAISGTEQQILEVVFENIQRALMSMQVTNVPIQKTDFIFSILPPEDTSLWDSFASRFTYRIPKPMNPTGLSRKISKLFSLPASYDLKTITAERFAEVICIDNYKKIISSDTIKNTYEVYIVVAGITAERIAIDPYEITPEKSFVHDLGIS